MDRAGTADPYVIVTVGSEQRRTQIQVTSQRFTPTLFLFSNFQRNTLNPTWNEQFTFEVRDHDRCPYFIYVEVYDWDTLGKNDFIGSLMLPLNEFVGARPRRIHRAPLGLCLS